ncbi:CopD family protein [Oligoflexus tunisiensis]|uniref:CopD family protein n=1 Tax=Oligoflexus tunisiensis TaxID=708132 RepID=UPI000A8B5C2B|nr:CopD family protein [Oligoflexus tunisiensis]
MEWYRSILAFHVIAIISWMAGILYLYRLLVYCAERRHEHPKVEELLQTMSRRLWKAITLPAMIAAWIAGLAMIHLNPGLMKMPWFHVKLLSVILMTASTLYAGKQVGVVQRSETLPRGGFFRFMNEVPTLLMIVVVIMVIVRPWS